MESPVRKAEGAEQSGGLPPLLSALVAPHDDPRQFRRYPVRMDVGISSLPCPDPEEEEESEDKTAHSDKLSQNLIYRSVEIHDLSMTGCRFHSAVPYRVGALMEIQLPLPQEIVILPGRIQRLQALPPGPYPPQFECGLNFLQSRMTMQSRRALMEFLVRQA